MFGEKIVATSILSWRSDRHNGQWLVSHIPFTRIQDFVIADVLAKIPKAHRYLSLAMSCTNRSTRRAWFHEDPLREEMRREANQLASRTRLSSGNLWSDARLGTPRVAGVIETRLWTRW